MGSTPVRTTRFFCPIIPVSLTEEYLLSLAVMIKHVYDAFSLGCDYIMNNFCKRLNV